MSNKTPTMTLEEYREYAKTGKMPGEKPKRSKYGNVRTTVNGKTYASKREADRAVELEWMVRAGEIAAVKEQMRFELEDDIDYIADFLIFKADGTWYVEDAKGVRTAEYKIKAKLFKKRYGQEIREV